MNYQSTQLQAHCQSPTTNALTKALSKSLQSQRTEKNCFKKFADTKKTPTHEPTEKK